jgi:hypothetical protein
MTTKAPAEASIQLKRLERVSFEVPIIGTAPLIVNRFAEKAKEMMLAAQQSSARVKKAPKDPVSLYEASKYKLEDGRDGFPSSAFKAATVHAARLFDGVQMTKLRQVVTVVGVGGDQLIPIEYGSVRMREDTVRNATGVADLRYRAEYWPWSATLEVHTISGQLDYESLVALVDAAGIGGVGEWRPASKASATGTYGTFMVVGS